LTEHGGADQYLPRDQLKITLKIFLADADQRSLVTAVTAALGKLSTNRVDTLLLATPQRAPARGLSEEHVISKTFKTSGSLLCLLDSQIPSLSQGPRSAAAEEIPRQSGKIAQRLLVLGIYKLLFLMLGEVILSHNLYILNVPITLH